MDLGLTDKTALVAAASAGLGRAAATSLAAEGARVAICSRNPARIEQTAAEIRAATDAEVVGVSVDLNSKDGPDAFFHAAAEALGPATIVVTNNGGPAPGPTAAIDRDGWNAAMDSTFFAPMRLVEAALPAMRDAQWGRIVHIASISVKQPLADMATSNACRAALAAWAKTFSREVAPSGITVHTVCPGPFDTDRTNQAIAAIAKAKGLSADQVRAEWSAHPPVGRIGDPAELGDLVAFLCSERASYLTGTAISIDGGTTSSLA